MYVEAGAGSMHNLLLRNFFNDFVLFIVDNFFEDLATIQFYCINTICECVRNFFKDFIIFY